MIIEVLENGEVVDVILATEEFARMRYGDNFRISQQEISQQEVTAVPEDPCLWLIDIGPFFDRFGAVKMPVLTSTDAGVKAILADTQVRKWIDLKRTDVAQSIAYIASVVPSLTTELQDSILNTPVSLEENLALRRIFFS